MNIFNELNSRGLIKQSSSEYLSGHLSLPRTLYCGFDPTADSLHVGSLLPLITMLRFKKAGHNVLGLVGGATGLIGDPSFKDKERETQNENDIENRVHKISKQIQDISGARIINNRDWMDSMNILTFLRDIGKHFSVNTMIAKESVKQRIERDDSGISFTEFTYSLIQANDFKELAIKERCTLQIGGSDQWGNMVAGLDLIKKTTNQEANCITIPLVIKSDGTKFGKTESGTVWLDPKLTTPFQFFQFWLNTSDQDIENFFKWFSLKSIEEINDIFAIDRNRKNEGMKPLAQELLAKEMTALIHGEKELEKALKLTKALFSNSWDLDLETLQLLSDEGFTKKINQFDFENMDWPTLLVNLGLAKSKNEGRRFISGGGVKIFSNSENDNKPSFDKISDLQTNMKSNNFIANFSLIKRGKKNAAFLEIV